MPFWRGLSSNKGREPPELLMRTGQPAARSPAGSGTSPSSTREPAAHRHQQQNQNAPQHFEPCCLPKVLVESGSCRQ